ncbi:c-type cytochrome [Caulobacter sp. KR2-114]|uniref:c-type cytochrome n=1 Tax=Caulobacter sp. KR2-114 TaxID=3400912 RepID=UPI003C09FFFE
MFARHRRLIASLIVVVLLLGGGYAWVMAHGASLLAAPRAKGPDWSAPAAELADPAAIARGQRLATVTACGVCHGQDMAGHRQMLGGSPFYAPNLTLAARKLSDADFERALRRGVTRDGRSEVVMPAFAYAGFTDAETADLLAWLRSLPPKGAEQPVVAPGFGARWNLVIGRYPLQADRVARRRPPADPGPAVAEGRHLASVACSQCHGADLAGGQALPGPDITVNGYYDRAQFHRLLRTGDGRTEHDLGVMALTARSNLSHFSDAEIDAIYDYLIQRDRLLLAGKK